MKGKEKLQFQQFFLEKFGRLKPMVGWKMYFFFAVIEQINMRCTFLNTASCNKQHTLYRIVLTLVGDWGGAFLARTQKTSLRYWIDLKFATYNGTDDTGKHAKFKVIGCSTFRDMMSQNFHKSSGFNIYPLKLSKTQKESLFMPENIFSGAKFYPPPCISMVFTQNQKNSYAQFFETSHFRNNCSNPW